MTEISCCTACLCHYPTLINIGWFLVQGQAANRMILPPLVEHIGVQQTAAERRLQVYPGDAKGCYEAKTPPGSKGRPKVELSGRCEPHCQRKELTLDTQMVEFGISADAVVFCMQFKIRRHGRHFCGSIQNEFIF